MQLSKVSATLVQVLPATFDRSKTYPLIIFGHGQGGQWGIDSLAQGELPEVVQKSADDFGFIVLAPWTPNGWQVSHYDSTVAYAKANLPIDWKRVYLLGLSMGGDLVTKVISTDRANELSAVAVACGVNSLSTGTYVKSAGLGCVFFHAVNDDRVGIQHSRDAVKRINDTLPPVKAKIVEYPDGGHYIWGTVFSVTGRPWTGNELPATVYDWLLMNTSDKSVEVPMGEAKTIPAGLTAKATAMVSGGQILLNGEQSTGWDSISWTDISPVKGVWVGGTGWKTAVNKPTKTGTYTFELKAGKGGVFVTDTVSIAFTVGVTDPLPGPKTVKSWDEVTKQITFSDGTTEYYTNLIHVVGDPLITLKTATGTYKV